MAVTVEQLQVDVITNTEQAEAGIGGLADVASRAGAAIHDGIGGLLDFGKGALGAALGGVQVLGDVMGDFIDKASEAQESQYALMDALNHTSDVTGVSAEMTQQLADSLGSVTRFDDDAVAGAEAILARYDSISSETFPLATQSALDLATALHKNLSTATKQIAKDLDQPVRGLKDLEKAGVSFTQAQKDQVAQMVKAGDVTGAQSILLERLNAAYGGAAQTAGQTFAGRLDILNNKFDNMKEVIGGAAIPVIEDLVTTVTPAVDEIGKELPVAIGIASTFFQDHIAPAIGAVLPLLLNFGQVGLNAIGMLMPLVSALAGLLTGSLIPVVIDMATWFSQHIWPIIIAIAGAIQSQLGPMIASLTQAIHQAQPFVMQLWQAFKQLLPIIELVAGVIGASLAIGIGVAMGALRAIIGALSGVMQFITGFAQYVAGIWDIITGIFTLNGDKIKEGIGLLVSGIKNMFFGLFSAVIGAVSGFVSGFLGFIDHLTGGALGRFKDWLGSVKDTLVSGFNNLISWATTIGGKFIGGLVDGIKNGAGRIGQALKDAVSSGVHNIPVIGGLIPGFAGGGITPGGPVMVGELGPEILIPPAGSQVIDSDLTRGIMAGAGGGSGGGMMVLQIQLDGYTLAEKVMRYTPDLVRIATGQGV